MYRFIENDPDNCNICWFYLDEYSLKYIQQYHPSIKVHFILRSSKIALLNTNEYRFYPNNKYYLVIKDKTIECFFEDTDFVPEWARGEIPIGVSEQLIKKEYNEEYFEAVDLQDNYYDAYPVEHKSENDLNNEHSDNDLVDFIEEEPSQNEEPEEVCEYCNGEDDECYYCMESMT